MPDKNVATRKSYPGKLCAIADSNRRQLGYWMLSSRVTRCERTRRFSWIPISAF